MGKVDDFKLFVKNNPRLISYVRDNKNTWQEFFELYDLYGDDTSVWNKYLDGDNNNSSSNPLSSIIDTVKKMDADKLQDGLSSMQKAIDLFGGLFAGNKSSDSYNPRPVYKRFDD